ncbi:MAG: pyridoxamine 5'-phosphate oxidase [Gammaproteobacteria bacterium]|nr:pyridoxamine 5'-phosphate oxidase [Gammaproteobacteria bacterium]
MSIDYDKLRREYRQVSLQETDMHADPIIEFESWFKQAVDFELELPNAMVLATVDELGKPAARYVLLKSFDDRGFVFYSHSVSAKGQQMAENPAAALVFYWSPLHRQVRVEGKVEALSAAEADEYFASRPYGSRIAVWVADQSSTVDSRGFMEERIKLLEGQYPDTVPRPETWIGYRVVPDSIEFWQGRENRLHDRILYETENGENWLMKRLAP